MSGIVLIMTLFGGTGTLLGPFVGAGVFIWMRDFLSKYLEYWEVFVGGAFVLIVLFLPDGIVGSLTRLVACRRAPAAVPAEGDQVLEPERLVGARRRPRPEDGQLLESQGLTKTFGGLTAVNRVDFQVREGELRSVIGPNGAGKTTFFNLLTGVLPAVGRPHRVQGRGHHRAARARGLASRHRALLSGDEHLRRPHRLRERAHRGPVARHPLPLLGQRGRAHRGERARGGDPPAPGPVRQAARARRELSHGEQRYLEIGIALATDPDFLLLDEPTAGMSPDETQRTAAFVRRLAGHVTIVVVEHDMEVVMGISDRITVLNYGEILAEGSPAEIRENADVRRVYLRD